MFGTERALQEGREGPDFESEWVVGENKSRERYPKWLIEAIDKVRSHAKDTGKLPVVTLTEKGRYGFLVVIDSRDFEEFFGFICEGPEDLEGLDNIAHAEGL